MHDPCPVCSGAPSHRRRVDRAGDVAVCGECGTWHRTPRPTAEDLIGIYNQDYYDAWGLDEDESIASRTKEATFAGTLRRLERMVGQPDGRKPVLLDVGAATGLLLAAAEKGGWDPYGVELNPYSANVLRERYGAERVFEGELIACTFPDSHFDAVTMTDVIEHVLDMGGTLRTAARLLRPGGVLCITTPRVDTLSRRLMGRRWLHFKAEHIQYLSGRAVDQALRAAGFDDVRVRGHAKSLSLDYLHAQLQTYPHWFLTPAVALIRRCLPMRLRRRPVRYRCGEMLVTARRVACPAEHL